MNDDMKLLCLQPEWAIFRDMWRNFMLGKRLTLKLLEVIGRSAYFLAWSILTALHLDINQTAGSGDTPSM